MRIKWNRHLDGSSSHRPEDDGTGTQEADKKKDSASSSSIFKIFRRKKSRRRGEDETKTDCNNGNVPSLPSEIYEDDCASISSIATCSSQPVNENFQRDRASSLFSSFRLSLPGSKRKKRKIAPTPSETLLSTQENEPQIERYSTPDLRKTSDKLEIAKNAQSSLSTSSPSIRNPKKSSVSAQSLDVGNSESADKGKWSNLKCTSSSSSKLSKSVSFSDCGDGFTNLPHSTSDNKVPWATNSTVMVEEDSEAFESELSACLSDNPLMNRESKFTAYDLSSSTVNASGLQKNLSSEAAGTAVTLKAQEVFCGNSTIREGQNTVNFGNILNDIASENRIFSEKSKEDSIDDNASNNLTSSSLNYDSVEYHSYESKSIKKIVNEENDKDDETCVSFISSSPKFNKNDIDYSPTLKSNSENLNRCKNSLPENNEKNVLHINQLNETEVSLNKKLEVLSSELSVLTAASDLSSLSSCDISNSSNDLKDTVPNINEDFHSVKQCSNKSISSKIPFENEIIKTHGKHLLCHLRMYDNVPLKQNLKDSNIVDIDHGTTQQPDNLAFQGNKIPDQVFNHDPSINIITNKTEDLDKKHFPDSETSNDLEKCENYLKSLSFVGEPNIATLCSEKKDNCDRLVPNINLSNERDRLLQDDQQVPDLELSILEFEEVCKKYMSQSSPEFTYHTSTFPFYKNSPKRTSVLDLNSSLIYPNFLESGKDEKYLQTLNKSEMASSCCDRIQHIENNSHPQLQNSCQTLTETYLLPSPPKQWINYEKSIDNEYNSNVCTDEVQCTNVRGKNLCQEPCLEVLPTTVMLHDSNSGGIDTPQLSSTLQAFENKSGRENSSFVTSEEQNLFDDHAFSKDMISNVSMTVSTVNGVLNYSCPSETPGKASLYFDSEIRDVYRGPRAICDPLVYSTDVSKGLESLGAENYLNSHNFCDIKKVGFCDVISDASLDYSRCGNALIEISNPYEDSFIVPDLANRNSMNDTNVSLFDSSSVHEPNEKIDHINNNDTEVLKNSTDENYNTEIFDDKESGNNFSTKLNIKSCQVAEEIQNLENRMSVPVDYVSDTTTGKLKQPLLNGKDHCPGNNLNFIKQKNVINKNKNSMIPCRQKGFSETKNKIETKSKSKKSNSLPRSQLSEKSYSSHRVVYKSHKDSSAEQQPRGKQKDYSAKAKRNFSNDSSNSEVSGLESDNKNRIVCEKSNYATEESRASSVCSSSVSEISCYTGDVSANIIDDCSLSEADLSNSVTDKTEFNHAANIVSSTSTDNIPSTHGSGFQELDGSTSLSRREVEENYNNISKFTAICNGNGVKYEGFCPRCLNLDDQEPLCDPNKNVKYQYCSKHLDATETPRRTSLPALGLRKTSLTSSKESLSSQLTNSSNRGISRIPTILSKLKRSVSGTFTSKRDHSTEQSGTRGTQSSKGPVRPPMWLSKAELTQEIQRLGTLCETRTKELNRLKMETKHVSVGFDAFAALFKYMVEDLNGLSVPALTQDLEKTLKQLELTKQDLAYYEREVEEMKSHHCQELNDLSNKLFEVYQSEVAELNTKHQEEINHIKCDHQKQMEHLTAQFDDSSAETKASHEKIIASLEQEIVNQREELQQFQEREIKDLEEKHTEGSKLLQDHIEQLQKKCAELKQHSMSMEDAMQKDTDSKLQWVSAAKGDLEKEVESLKAVLEMKNKELHSLRVQNLEMEKQLEELPLAREKIKMLQARAEDLEALLEEKTKLERRLATENLEMRDAVEKEAKIYRRLSMENEELQWRLRQAENSLISGSFSEVPEFPEAEESAAATSPTKSPGPQMLSRSVFFTFVDKDASSPHSPRTQYKKISPNFSANYKTSPAKSSKSPPAPSPRRAKSHSEPPHPINTTSTPIKVAKQPLSKTKGSQKRQRSGSDSTKLSEHVEVNSSSVTESMTSSVSSESSVFEHREKLLEEHREHIIHSLEILREQRSTESADEHNMLGKKWCSDDIKITGELSNLETEDMSRSAEFADPKTYYHMTFPVLKESGITDCDMEDSSKNSTNGSSPVKEIVSHTMHSVSENNLTGAVEASKSVQITEMASQMNSSGIKIEKRKSSCTTLNHSSENIQKEAASDSQTENRWRTI